MKLALHKSRGPSITVIGAISQQRGLVHFEVFDDSNDAQRFNHFLQGLKSQCRGKRVVVVLDNLKIHHAKMLNDAYDSDFKEMFLPPYSSELNPIERLWSVLKRKWAQNLYRLTEEFQSQPQLRNVLRKTLERLKEMICKTLRKVITL